MPLKFRAPNLHKPAARPYKEQYGSNYIASKYCGFEAGPRKAPGLWQHGVLPLSLELSEPEQIFGVTLAGLADLQYWVATKKLAEFMRARGFAKVRAIGMPIIYAAAPPVERRRGSLLVMPAHSLDTMRIDWNPRAYVEAIREIAARFREVVVCVNTVCWDRGLWVPEFQAAGFNVIRGADHRDVKTLDHLAALFGQFEFVTTNSYGSHVAYAPFFGARVSIHGPFSALTPDTLRNIPFYVDNPHLIAPAVEAHSEARLRRAYPGLFCAPDEAPDTTEFARGALGREEKVTPGEMRKLFGWTMGDQLREKAAGLLRPLGAPKARPKASEVELDRVKALPHFEPGRTKLFGREFEFVDGPTYASMLEEQFKRQIYRFKAATAEPRILDGGANVGLSVLFFKCLYPEARVTAFEPDPGIFEVLARNVAVYELENVELVPKALWNCETHLAFQREGALSGRLSQGAGGAATVDVPTCRLADYLQEPVDLLKLDIEGAETAVLLDSAPHLRQVRNIIVEHHSFLDQPQTLHTALALLADAGFRVYIEPAAQSKRPLVERKIVRGMDVQLNLFGFRP